MPKEDKFDGGAFEAFGEWHLSHNQDHTFVGLLTFSPDSGLELRVVDPTGREGLATFQWGKPIKERVSAFGHTQSHGHISLFDGFVRSKPTSSHGPAETIYFFNHGLLGLAVSNAHEQKFVSVHTTGELLRAFLDQNLVKHDLFKVGRTAHVRHTLPKPLHFPIDKKRKLHIAWDRQGPSLSIAQSSVAITSRPWVGLKYVEPQSLTHALRGIDSVTRLIAILSGFEFRSSLVEFRISSESLNEQHSGPIYFLASRQKLKSLSGNLSPRDLLFRFPAIRARFAALANRWFEVQREVPGCINTFFSANYSTYTNQRLFALTTVLEALHRYLRNKKKCSLRVRLVECMNEFPNLMPTVVGDANAFATKVVQSRNSEAHCIEDENAGNGSEHLRLLSKLRVIIDAMLLKKLGVTEEEMSLAMRGSYEYWFYASNETWPWGEKN